MSEADFDIIGKLSNSADVICSLLFIHMDAGQFSVVTGIMAYLLVTREKSRVVGAVASKECPSTVRTGANQYVDMAL